MAEQPDGQLGVLAVADRSGVSARVQEAPRLERHLTGLEMVDDLVEARGVGNPGGRASVFEELTAAENQFRPPRDQVGYQELEPVCLDLVVTVQERQKAPPRFRRTRVAGRRFAAVLLEVA